MSIYNPQDLLFNFAKKLAYNYVNVKNEFHNWKTDDARLVTYIRCSNTVENVLYCFIFLNEQLVNPDWYKKIPYIKSPTLPENYTIRDNFHSFLTVAFVTQYFACFEIFIRNLITELVPSYKGSKFYAICEKILEELDLKKYYIDYFDMYRFIRNSLHTNGIVTDKYTRPIYFKGTIYNFELGTQVKVNWLMLTQLSQELYNCLNQIVYSDKIRKIYYIKDPSYYEFFNPA